jgi:hypothetical protein
METRATEPDQHVSTHTHARPFVAFPVPSPRLSAGRGLGRGDFCTVKCDAKNQLSQYEDAGKFPHKTLQKLLPYFAVLSVSAEIKDEANSHTETIKVRQFGNKEIKGHHQTATPERNKI